MKEFGLKLCFFLFLVVAFSGRTSELGTLVGAVTGTILFWPLYRKVVPAVPRKRRKVMVEEEELDSVA
jgi:hypothetical protein